MKFFKYLLLVALLHGYPSCSMGQTVDKTIEANYALGLNSETNLIKNPSAGKNRRYVTAVGLTITRDTSVGNKINNKASWSIDATAINDYQEFELIPTPDDLTSGNCGFSGIFKGDGRLYKAQILDGSSVVLAQTVVLTNETGWREFKVWHPCGASGARKVRITQTEAGTAPAINVGKLFYGRMEPGAGVPPNTFTALVSGTGVVSRETGDDWINGNCTQTSGNFLCTFTSGVFKNAPNCIGSLYDSSSSDQTMNRVASSTVDVSILTRSGAGTGTSIGFTLTCTKTGADYIQPAITPQNFDYDWKDYSQAVVAESGTFPTYTLNLMQQARFAGKLYLKGKLTMTGTNTWSDIRIPVPTGLQILTSVIAPGGINYFDAGSNFYMGSIVSMNASYIRVGSKSGTNGQGLIVNQAAPFTWASGDTVEWFIGPIDVVGWTTSSAAPQLVGSVTSNSNNALRIEQADITTICSVNGSCALGASYGSSVTITRTAQGRYTFAYPAFSSRPVCAVSPVGGLPYAIFAASDIPTTTSVAIGTRNSSLSDTDLTFSISCIGPR